MIKIFFEAHSTSLDNERHLSSGHNDVDLSELGIQQSKELGIRYANTDLDAVFCSDLIRSYRTAEIAFGTKLPILKDSRLRECDYGDFTQKASEIVENEKIKRVNVPFPNGESYIQCLDRMKSFLIDLSKNYQGKTVLIIGHRATQYGIENFINRTPIEELVTAKFKWQPGWTYNLD